MALPKLLQKLFQNGGAGDKLNPEIVPEIKKLMLGDHVLELHDDGTLKLDENLVITSAGGTMTGAIRFDDGNAIYQTKDSAGINVYGGSDTWKGAGLQLFGMSSNGNEGHFQIYANNGSISSGLLGKPDGALTWGGKEVERVTSKNGVCLRYESGLQICWGSDILHSSGTQITFPLPFNGGSVHVVATPLGTPSNWALGTCVDNVSNTGFKGFCQSGLGCQWMAIGYWK